MDGFNWRLSLIAFMQKGYVRLSSVFRSVFRSDVMGGADNREPGKSCEL